MKIKRERIYWLCQLAGWSLYTAINTVLFAAFGNYSGRQFSAQLLICGAGFSLTLFFRLFVKRHNWEFLKLKSLIPRIIAACLVLAVVWQMFSLLILLFVFQFFTIPEIKFEILLVTLFNYSTTLLIWSLIYFGFHSVENYRKSEIEKWKLEAAVKEAELRALKSQMNPHFIFNCLNSIRALIVEDADRAQTVVTQLASILRYSLQSRNCETVPLAEELQMVSDYLALEKTRFEERLTVHFDIDPASLGVHVPVMLIQTVAENGIKHGIATLSQGGKIVLTSRLQDSTLSITIKNSGRLTDSTNTNGVGLRNAAERLKLLFGDAATVKLESAGIDEVVARIEIPTQKPPPNIYENTDS